MLHFKGASVLLNLSVGSRLAGNGSLSKVAEGLRWARFERGKGGGESAISIVKTKVEKSLPTDFQYADDFASVFVTTLSAPFPGSPFGSSP